MVSEPSRDEEISLVAASAVVPFVDLSLESLDLSLDLSLESLDLSLDLSLESLDLSQESGEESVEQDQDLVLSLDLSLESLDLSQESLDLSLDLSQEESEEFHAGVVWVVLQVQVCLVLADPLVLYLDLEDPLVPVEGGSTYQESLDLFLAWEVLPVKAFVDRGASFSPVSPEELFSADPLSDPVLPAIYQARDEELLVVLLVVLLVLLVVLLVVLLGVLLVVLLGVLLVL